MSTIFGCTRIVTTDKFSPELFLELVEKYKVTSIFSATSQLVSVLKCKLITKVNLTTLKSIVVGGAKVPYATTVQFSKYAPNSMTCVCYGMSEFGGAIAMNYPPLKNDAVGRLVIGASVKIVDKNGKRLGTNENGEICAKFPIPFYGYYNNLEATINLFDDEGFIQTGDIGRFDTDGNLYFVDRKKDILKYRSYMVSPTEIEDFLINLNGIKLVCVVGVDDYESGDLPAVVIVRAENSNITEKDVFEMAAEQFSDAKKLRGGVYFVDLLSVTASGKIIRKEVKHMVNDLYRLKMDH